jgi:hypothetical protein
LETKWVVISRAIAIFGGIGMSLAIICGLINQTIFNSNPILGALVGVFIFVGMIIPICITFPLLINRLIWISKMEYRYNNILYTLWKQSWIVFTMIIFVLLTLTITMYMAYFSSIQLFAVITLRSWVIQVLFVIGVGLFDIFVLNTRPPKLKITKSNPEIFATTHTPQNSTPTPEKTDTRSTPEKSIVL